MADFEMNNLSKVQKIALILALVLCDALLLGLDVVTGDSISMAPLFAIPVVVAGLLLGNISLVVFAVIATVLRVEAYRRTAYSGTDFPYFPNLSATFLSMCAVGGVVVLARDYRERVRAQQAISVGRRTINILREDDLRLLESLLIRAPVAVSVFAGGLVRFANPKATELLGLHVGDPSSKCFASLADYEHMKSNLANQDTYHFDNLKMRGADRELRDMIGSLTTIGYQGIPAILMWMTDISHVREAEQKLKEATSLAEHAAQLKSNFLANISHEIRTPMNAITGLAHLALSADLPPRERDYLQRINGASKHLLGVINDILDVAKIEAGKLTIEKIEFEIDQVIENLALLTAEKAGAKHLELEFRIDSDIPAALVGDPLRLGQILLNYVNNAVKFTDRGSIIVSLSLLEEHDDEVVLRGQVEDTGVGVTSSQSASLFQSFQQGDPSITRKHGGTGLGLVICKDLAEMMGGSVGFESEHVNGSRFWFTARLKRAASLQRHFPPGASGERQRVILVEGVGEDRKASRLSRLLSDMNLDVMAIGQDTALSLFSHQDYPASVTIFEFQSPNGIAFAKDGNLAELKLKTHCIAVADYGQEAAYAAAEAVGAETLLFRPFSRETLFRAIERGLNRIADEHISSNGATFDSKGRPEGQLEPEMQRFSHLTLNRLRNLVAASDVEALDVIFEHSHFLSGIFGDDFNSLKKAVADFEFERAAKLIEKYGLPERMS